MKKAFQSDTIGIEQEILDLRWLGKGEDELIANVYSIGGGETLLVSVTSDMVVNGMGTIELVTSPVEMNNNSGIQLRKLAVEAVTRILYECAEQKARFPLCEIIRKDLSLVSMGGGDGSDAREWKITIPLGESSVLFRLTVYDTPAVRFAQNVYPTTTVRFNSQVSVGIPVEQLGSFLHQVSPPWWKPMSGGGKYYTLPERKLDDSPKPAIEPDVWPSESGNRAFAETAYNYFMCMLEFALTSEQHKICAPGEFLDAQTKNKWSVLPRCAPWETTCILLELADVSPTDFLRFTGPEYMKMGVVEEEHKEKLSSLLQSPGLTHTTLSGITIGEKPAVVMELRGPGNVKTYEAYLCADLRFKEIPEGKENSQ